MGKLLSTCIYEAFDQTVARVGDKPALIYLGKKFSYGELKDLVERFAANLLSLGIGNGDKAVMYLGNSPQWVIGWLALQRIGTMAIPIAPVYTPRDLKYIVSDCGAETIFCLDTNFGYVTEVLPETNVKRIIVTNSIDLLPWWKKFIGKALDRVSKGKIGSGKNVHTFKSLLRKSSLSLPSFSGDRAETIELLYTGGTIGFPKGVPLSSSLLLTRMREVNNATDPVIRTGNAVVVQSAPFYHMLGQGAGLRAIFFGETLLLFPRINLDAILDHVERYKATTISGVPALYRMILEHDRLEFYDLSSIKYSFCGGDVLPIEISDRWLKKFGEPIYQGYGATETGGAVSLTTAGDAPPTGAAGKMVPSGKYRIVDPDTLEAVPTGLPGELLVNSEHMVRGYWNKPEETAECFVNFDGSLWYRTGDIVSIDNNGWIFFHDRSADIIKHKGYRVAASKIEAVLQEHPSVVAACVVGVPDPKVGERIKAFVVAKEDVRGIGAYALMEWCRKRLASYEVPHYIEYRDMLPKSKVGKLLRREMKKEERRKLEQI